MGVVTLFTVGFVAATLLWLGLVWIPRRLAPADALRAFAARHGQPVRGDGLAQPLTIVGRVRGRTFSITWQRHWVGGDVLLVGVDCATAADGPVGGAPPSGGAGGAVEGAITEAGDAALVTRWTRPAADVLEPDRLLVILESLARMAEDLEADQPPSEPDVD